MQSVGSVSQMLKGVSVMTTMPAANTTRTSGHTGRAYCLVPRARVRLFGVPGSLLLVFLVPAIVSAGAFRIFDHSASATGQGGAFTAQADDPSAVYFNPAGMTQLSGIQTSAGTLLLGGSTRFTSPSGMSERPSRRSSSPPLDNVWRRSSASSSARPRCNDRWNTARIW